MNTYESGIKPFKTFKYKILLTNQMSNQRSGSDQSVERIKKPFWPDNADGGKSYAEAIYAVQKQTRK